MNGDVVVDVETVDVELDGAAARVMVALEEDRECFQQMVEKIARGQRFNHMGPEDARYGA